MVEALEAFGCYVDGAEATPAAAPVAVIDPCTGRQWAQCHSSPDAAASAMAAAERAFASPEWRDLVPSDRAGLLDRLAVLVREHKQTFARYEELATGKLARFTTGEADHVADVLRHHAGLCETSSGRLVDLVGDFEARVVYEPYGVAVLIVPFNGALSLGTWKLAPALAAGNTVVVKPPYQAPASLLLFARLATEAGFPAGVVNVVPGDAAIAEPMLESPHLALLSFTGSTEVARRLGERMGRRLVKFVCEAGGKSANIVFDDADLDDALVGVTQGVFSNTGQTCVAGSRLLVHQRVADEFITAVAEKTRELVVGPTADPRSDVGPLASRGQAERVRRLLDDSVAEGGRMVVGADSVRLAAPYSDGYFVAPTIFADSDTTSTPWTREFFGPVLATRRFATDADAVSLANASEYGLAAGIWTRDLTRAHRVSRALQAGTVWINTYRQMNARLPFGGYKQSGLGRENGPDGFFEYLQAKTIITGHSSAADPFASR